MSAEGVRKASSKQKTHAAPRGTLPALIGHTLWLQFRGTLIWGLALGALGALYVAIYPSFADQPQYEELINNMPQAAQDLAGYQGSAFSSIEGFLATEMLNLIVPLTLAFFPILASASAIAGAEERGTIDVLLSNPLPRWQLVAGKFVATAISLLGILAIMGLIMWLTAQLADVDLSSSATSEGALNLWPLCMFFGALAMLCSAMFRRRSLAIAIPGALLILMYFVDSLANSVEILENLQPLSAFYYYGSAIKDGIEWGDFGLLIAVAVVLVALAALAFRRRDIYT